VRAAWLAALLFGLHASASADPLVNIRDYGGYADAIRGGAHYAASGSSVGIGALQFLTVTITAAEGASTAVVSPPSALPDLSALPKGFYVIDVPGAGPAGAAAHGTLLTADTVTGVITFAAAVPFSVRAAAPAIIELYQAGYPNRNTINGGFYGPVSIEYATDSATGAVYGSRLTLSRAMIPFIHGSTGSDGIQVCIDAANRGGWCGVVVNDSVADGKTLVAAGTGNDPVAIPYRGVDVIAKVAWGPFLFRHDDATACRGSPRVIEVPGAGSGRAAFGGQVNALQATVATRYDALSATLARPVGTTVAAGNAGVEGYLVSGCDDWPAYQRAVNAAYRNPATVAQGFRLYFPADSFMASAFRGEPGAASDLAVQCGQGTVFWPNSPAPFFHGATGCDRTRITSFPDAKDIVPAVHLKRLSSLPPGSAATIVLAGNSPAVPNSNGANFVSGRLERICAAFQSAYPDLAVRCVDRSRGGTRMASLDPGGYTNGIAYGSAPEPWYGDPSRPWLLGYIQPDSPDVLILGFSDQEGTAAELSAMINIQAATQGKSWLAATGKNPDLLLIPWPWQSGTGNQVGMNAGAAVYRAYAKACATRLAAGGCWGLIDEARLFSIIVDGVDPETAPMRRSGAMPPPRAAIRPSPDAGWSYAVPRTGMSVPVTIQWDGASPGTGAMLAAAGGELDFTISGNANLTPQNQTVTAAAVAGAAAGQASINVGSAAYMFFRGYGISGHAAIPPGARVRDVDGPAGTVTLNTSLTGSLPAGTRLVFAPPGPGTGYPGGMLRISKDAATGNLAYRYDTVFFQVANADCSGTAGDDFITCASAEVGHWHRGMQIAVPTAGTGACPNPGGAADCFVATIGALSYDVGPAGITWQRIDLRAGSTAAGAAELARATVPVTFTARRPFVFRTSIPLTVSGAAAEALASPSSYGSNCRLTPGVRIFDWFLVEYRGSRASAAFCYAVGPGRNWFLNQFLERFDSPFLFTIDTPNHFARATNYWLRFNGPAYADDAPSGSAIGGGTWEVSPEYPEYAATARLAPDIYGWCAGYPTGDPDHAPWGGTCQSHYGQMGANLIDDEILRALRLR
jgi:hypothetical protein